MTKAEGSEYTGWRRWSPDDGGAGRQDGLKGDPIRVLSPSPAP